MAMGMKLLPVLTLSAALTTISTPAWAYLDPGSISLGLQAVLAVVVGGLVSLKLYWHRLKTVFGKKQPADEKRENGD